MTPAKDEMPKATIRDHVEDALRPFRLMQQFHGAVGLRQEVLDHRQSALYVLESLDLNGDLVELDLLGDGVLGNSLRDMRFLQERPIPITGFSLNVSHRSTFIRDAKSALRNGARSCARIRYSSCRLIASNACRTPGSNP